MQVPMKASWGHEAPVERRVPPKRISSLHGAWLQGQAALAASCQDPGYTARNQVSVVASFPPLRTPSRLTSRQGRCTQGASCLCCDLRGDISVRTEQPAKEPTAVPPPLGDPSLEREREGWPSLVQPLESWFGAGPGSCRSLAEQVKDML